MFPLKGLGPSSFGDMKHLRRMQWKKPSLKEMKARWEKNMGSYKFRINIFEDATVDGRNSANHLVCKKPCK